MQLQASKLSLEFLSKSFFIIWFFQVHNPYHWRIDSWNEKTNKPLSLSFFFICHHTNLIFFTSIFVIFTVYYSKFILVKVSGTFIVCNTIFYISFRFCVLRIALIYVAKHNKGLLQFFNWCYSFLCFCHLAIMRKFTFSRLSIKFSETEEFYHCLTLRFDEGKPRFNCVYQWLTINYQGLIHRPVETKN